MCKPHWAFPAQGVGLYLPNLCKPQAAAKSIAGNDGNHCSTEAWMTTFLTVLERRSSSCNIFWETSHFSSPGEDMESTHVFYGKAWVGFSKHKLDNKGQNKSWLNFKAGMSLIQRRKNIMNVFLDVLLSHWAHSGFGQEGFAPELRWGQRSVWAVQPQGNPSSLSTLHNWSWVRGWEVLRLRLHLSGWDHSHFLFVLQVKFQCICVCLLFPHVKDKNQTDLKMSLASYSSELWFTLPLIHCCEKWPGILLWI